MQASEQRAIQRILSVGEWFSGLPPALQELILSRSVVKKFAKGQVISVEDSAQKGLFAVLEGQVHLVREISTGDEALMQVGEPAYWFGEFGLLTGRPTVVTVIAHSPVRALVLSKVQFDRILAEDPRYYQAFANLIFDRYESLIRVFAELRDLAPESRLRARLAAMARLQMRAGPGAAPVSLAVSQADLARMVGVSRQTLNALLGKLREVGLVEVEFRRIRVLDAARLTDPRGEVDPTARGSASAQQRASGAPTRASGERINR